MRRRARDGRGDLPGAVGVRGGLAGVAMAALAVAAHGMAGGGFPGSPELALLISVAAAIGAVASTLRSRATLPVLMLVGQPVCHLALSGLLHDGHGSAATGFDTGAMMAAAHAAAALAFALLILVAERLYGIASQAIRVTLSRIGGAPVAPRSRRWARVSAAARGLSATGAIGPRAPPVTA
ncbi:hypothetical protein [Nocardia jejuensis]|uniref:hypothetical protein n=1 Tax=Nocardia jejuensis TaxID=328049 RepID=UPI000830E2B1|nr:hypothetical protein [Nocardia jejuensis]